eukprot:gene11728-5067_t
MARVIASTNSPSTAAVSGHPLEKYYFFKAEAQRQGKFYKAFNDNPSGDQIKAAFKSNNQFYIDMDVTDIESQRFLCNELIFKPTVTFVAGYTEKNFIQTMLYLKNCRKRYSIEQLHFVPLESYFKIFGIFGLIFICFIGNPILCCLGLKLYQIRISSGLKQFIKKENAKYQQQGVQLSFNDSTQSVDIFFYIGSVPQLPNESYQHFQNEGYSQGQQMNTQPQFKLEDETIQLSNETPHLHSSDYSVQESDRILQNYQ